MESNPNPFVSLMVVCLVTYLLHSTLLLGATWSFLRLKRTTSHYLTDRLWKLAALSGFVTTALQVGTGLSDPVFRLALLDDSMPRSLPALIPAATNNTKFGDLDWQSSVPKVSRSPGVPVPSQDDSKIGPAESMLLRRLMGKEDVSEHQDTRTAITALGNRLASHHSPNDGSASVSAGHSQTVLQYVRFPGAELLLVVLCAGVARLTWQNLRFRRHVSRCRTMRSGPARQVLDGLCQRLGVGRPVTVLSSPSDPEPAAFGLWRWRIVLHKDVEQRLSKDELTALLTHELGHLVRGDAIWLLVGRLLCTCFAFQPLNFLAKRRWQRAAEFQCDDWAVHNGASALSLARCLTRVAEWRLDHRVSTFALPAGGENSDLGNRIERLIESERQPDPWSSRTRLYWLAALTVGVVLSVSYWAPGAQLLAESTPGQPVGGRPRDHRTLQAGDNAFGPDHRLIAVPRLELPEPDRTAGRFVDEPRSTPPGTSLHDELQMLDGELQLLTLEWRRLDGLLKRSNLPPEAQSPAERLQTRMDEFGRRREWFRTTFLD